MKHPRTVFGSFLRTVLLLPFLFVLLVIPRAADATTEEMIELSIDNGIAWLAGAQLDNGSWNDHTAISCMALIKLQDRAYELGFESPFDSSYPYFQKVIDGWEYVFSAPFMLQRSPLPVQSAGDPDTNGNGYGVYFAYDDYHHIYSTSLCLVAMVSSGTPDRPNDGNVDFDTDGNADTFFELAQEATDWLAFAQQDLDPRRGGWSYDAVDNGISKYGDWADNSQSGYAVLGLAAAVNFGMTIPQFVYDELNLWIDYIQDDTTGASGYADPWDWQNVLKTGNLLFQMKFVGDDPATSLRYEAALSWIEGMWQDPSNDPGWGYSLALSDYQAMFTTMKGLEFSNVDLIDTDGDGVRDNDWFNQEPAAVPAQDFASVLVAQQMADGSWPADCNWSWGDPVLCTAWALLTLEKISPKSDPFEIAVDKDYRYTSVCFEADNDRDGLFNEDPLDFDALGLPIDNDRDGLFNEDDFDCDPSDTGYELPLTGIDPEAYTLLAVLKKNGKVSSYNPGQYYAVSTVTVTRLDPRVESIVLTIDEIFDDCTIADKPLSVLNPKTGGGSVVLVEVIDGIAYQVADATSDVISIAYDPDGIEQSATATFEYFFEEDQETATLLVYVKFGPGLKNNTLPEDPLDRMCMNINGALLQVFEEGEEEPACELEDSAEAWLKVVPK